MGKRAVVPIGERRQVERLVLAAFKKHRPADYVAVGEAYDNARRELRERGYMPLCTQNEMAAALAVGGPNVRRLQTVLEAVRVQVGCDGAVDWLLREFFLEFAPSRGYRWLQYLDVDGRTSRSAPEAVQPCTITIGAVDAVVQEVWRDGAPEKVEFWTNGLPLLSHWDPELESRSVATQRLMAAMKQHVERYLDRREREAPVKSSSLRVHGRNIEKYAEWYFLDRNGVSRGEIARRFKTPGAEPDTKAVRRGIAVVEALLSQIAMEGEPEAA